MFIDSCGRILERRMKKKVALDTTPVTILWSVWKERNLSIFYNKSCEENEVFEMSK